jgi:hypothetical protein
MIITLTGAGFDFVSGGLVYLVHFKPKGELAINQIRVYGNGELLHSYESITQPSQRAASSILRRVLKNKS